AGWPADGRRRNPSRHTRGARASPHGVRVRPAAGTSVPLWARDLAGAPHGAGARLFGRGVRSLGRRAHLAPPAETGGLSAELPPAQDRSWGRLRARSGGRIVKRGLFWRVYLHGILLLAAVGIFVAAAGAVFSHRMRSGLPIPHLL